MKKLFTTAQEAKWAYEAKEHVEFFALMDRLRIHSDWKYPERKWTDSTYFTFSSEWSASMDQLEQRVIELETIMFASNG